MNEVYLVYARPRFDKEAKTTTYIVRGEEERDNLIRKLRIKGFVTTWAKVKNKSLDDLLDEQVAFTKMLRTFVRRVAPELINKKVCVDDDGQVLTLREIGSTDYLLAVVY